jgi:hypothetical protein
MEAVTKKKIKSKKAMSAMEPALTSWAVLCIAIDHVLCDMRLNNNK